MAHLLIQGDLVWWRGEHTHDKTRRSHRCARHCPACISDNNSMHLHRHMMKQWSLKGSKNQKSKNAFPMKDIQSFKNNFLTADWVWKQGFQKCKLSHRNLRWSFARSHAQVADWGCKPMFNNSTADPPTSADMGKPEGCVCVCADAGEQEWLK